MSRTKESPLEAGAANVHGLVPRATWEEIITYTIDGQKLHGNQEWFVVKKIYNSD